MNTKCIGCAEHKNCHDSYISWVFFIIGLVATVAIRVVTVLMNVNPVYGKIAWYIGVAGFFLFFLYKFNIIMKRKKMIEQQNIVRKLNAKEALKDEDYAIVSSIICGINSEKERINYFFIFFVSAIALIMALYGDFFK